MNKDLLGGGTDKAVYKSMRRDSLRVGEMYCEVPVEEISSGKVQVVLKGDFNCLKNKKAQPGQSRGAVIWGRSSRCTRKDGCSGVIHVGLCDWAARKEAGGKMIS